MNINDFITKVKTDANNVSFNETMTVIDNFYDFTETSFTNGNTTNEAGQNSGSCKLFSFAKLNNLTKDETLACFGDFYRVDVLQNPDANDHQNIRNFMQFGWNGISFSKNALVLK